MLQVVQEWASLHEAVADSWSDQNKSASVVQDEGKKNERQK